MQLMNEIASSLDGGQMNRVRLPVLRHIFKMLIDTVVCEDSLYVNIIFLD